MILATVGNYLFVVFVAFLNLGLGFVMARRLGFHPHSLPRTAAPLLGTAGPSTEVATAPRGSGSGGTASVSGTPHTEPPVDASSAVELRDSSECST